MEKMLPQNIDAEKSLLGSILIDPDAYDLVADKLAPTDFYRNAHQVIYEAIVQLVSRRICPDLVTILDELEQKDKLDDAASEGMYAGTYLTGLINCVPTSGNVEYYADIVSRLALCRRLIHAAGQITTLAYSQDANAVEKSEQLLFNIDRQEMVQAFFGMGELTSDYVEELTFLHENKGAFIGVPTGYDDIDNATAGLQKSDLILLGGRPSMGKTALGLCIGYNAALRGKRVAIFSLEMGKKQLMRRLMSMASKIDMQRLRSGWIEDGEWERIIDAASNLSQLPIWINDTAGNPISSMRRQLRRLTQSVGTPEIVIVDYIGLIESEDAKYENRVQEVSKISRGLKALAREFDVPILALAQLSRDVEKRASKRPMLSDLRDSGSLEQDADVVMFVYRDAYYAQQEGRTVEQGKENIADVSIAKQRNGPTGDVQLFFQPDQAMFYPLEVLLPSEGGM